MSYKPSKFPDCKSDVQMCYCQAWAKNDKENSILREALERIVNYQESRPWANRYKIAREALQKAWGEE